MCCDDVLRWCIEMKYIPREDEIVCLIGIIQERDEVTEAYENSFVINSMPQGVRILVKHPKDKVYFVNIENNAKPGMLASCYGSMSKTEFTATSIRNAILKVPIFNAITVRIRHPGDDIDDIIGNDKIKRDIDEYENRNK